MVIPKNITLKEWAQSLIVDFPSDLIPRLTDEEAWKNWGDALVQETSFASNAAPGTRFYEDWQPWAQAVFAAMANF